MGAVVAEASVQEHDAAGEIDVAGAFHARMAQMPRGLAPDVFRQQFLDSFEAVARSIADNDSSTPRQKVEQFLALESIGQAVGASLMGAEHRLGARSAINEVVIKLIHPKIGNELDPNLEHWAATFDAAEAAAQARLVTDPDSVKSDRVEAALKYIAHLPTEFFGNREDASVSRILNDALNAAATLSTLKGAKMASVVWPKQSWFGLTDGIRSPWKMICTGSSKKWRVAVCPEPSLGSPSMLLMKFVGPLTRRQWPESY